MRLKPLRISARHSDLARLQAYRVGDALKARVKDIEVEYAFRASLGDLNQHDPLWKMPEKGVFTEDFLKDLTEGSAEMVVHSWKDLPTEPRPETEIVATLPRADVRDLLLFRKDRIAQARDQGHVKILTSSPRRAHNLGEFLKEHLPFSVARVDFENVRGNIPTRLRKLMSQDVDGLIVAKAALDRLLGSPEEEFVETRDLIRSVLRETRFMVLPLSVNPTAAAQGALAVEVSKKRPEVREALASVNCEETFTCVQEERRILAGYGGGCHQKIGINVLVRGYGKLTFLRGLTDAGEVLDQVRLDGFVDQPKAAAEDKLFPRASEEAALFDREALPREAWAWAEGQPLLWVARETAWPSGFNPRQDSIVWTAGLRTWKKLASRGVWVSGSAESLGEEEPMRLEALLGVPGNASDMKWVKLTHAASAGAQGPESAMKACGTYRLVPKARAPDLKGRTHFFWMSGSSFDRAVELYPEIAASHHACGPGLTHRHITQRLGPEAKVAVYLGVDEWRKSVLGR